MKLDKETLERLDEFFTFNTDKKSFANELSSLMYETIGMTLNIDETQWCVDKGAVSSGYYWVHELCEILDPCT